MKTCSPTLRLSSVISKIGRLFDNAIHTSLPAYPEGRGAVANLIYLPFMRNPHKLGRQSSPHRLSLEGRWVGAACCEFAAQLNSQDFA